jgi:hypothetical protein
MQPPNLFGYLSRYRVGAHKTPIEDFFTQAFAWILDRNRKLAVALLKDLTGLEFDRAAVIQTQQGRGKDCRIDLEVSDDRHLLFIENKILAEVSVYQEGDETQEEDAPRNQIAKYQRLASQLCGANRKPFVLLISRIPDTCDASPPFKAALWSDVFDLLTEHHDLCEDQWRPLLDEFLGFMKEMRMTFEGLKPEDADIARRIDGVYSTAHQLLRQSLERSGAVIKYKTDWNVYAACYIQSPTSFWAGICYWGGQFGRIVFGRHDLTEKKKRKPFEEAGLTWDEATGMCGGILEFSEYGDMKPTQQVAKVSAFMNDTAARMSKLSS